MYILQWCTKSKTFFVFENKISKYDWFWSWPRESGKLQCLIMNAPEYVYIYKILTRIPWKDVFFAFMEYLKIFDDKISIPILTKIMFLGRGNCQFMILRKILEFGKFFLDWERNLRVTTFLLLNYYRLKLICDWGKPLLLYRYI
jgi:hypothetical protein